MAETISLEELLGHLDRFEEKTIEQCVEMMKEEAPVGPTGGLRDSIRVLERSRGRATIGTDIYYADWVENGRGPVTPKNATALRWYEYEPGPNSTHTMIGEPGEVIFSKYAGATKANDYLGRTENKIMSAECDLVGGFRWARNRATRAISRGLQNLRNLWRRG